MRFALLACIYVTLTAPLIAGEGIDLELRKKGKDCLEMARSHGLTRNDVSNCLHMCGRYGTEVGRNAELLTNDGVRKCNEAYSEVKEKIAGTNKPEVPRFPVTIDEIAANMRETAQICQTIAEDTTAPKGTRKHAKVCQGSCNHYAELLLKDGINSETEDRWKYCKEVGEHHKKNR